VTPTRPADLVGLWLLVGVITRLVVPALYGALPPVPVLAGSSLLVLAGVEVGLAVVLDPIMAARSVALAKASALGGAATAGVWSGLLVFVLGSRNDLSAAAADTPGAVVGLISAVLLVGAALFLEHNCRTPDDPGPRRD